MKKIIVDALAFQTTLRCNQNCAHCCKGKAQNVDMTKEVIDNLFRNSDSKITEIRHLSMTGGEPTLVPDLIEYLVNTIIELDIDITYNVIFITNGLIYDQSIIDNINKLMEFLTSKEKCKEVQLIFEISNDQYHKRPDKDTLDKYSNVPFLDKKFLEPRIRTVESTVNEGNAKDNNIGGSTTYKDFIEEMDVKTSNDVIEVNNTILITANGNVVNCSCGSYIEEDEISLGNLHNQSFLDIVSKYIVCKHI